MTLQNTSLYNEINERLAFVIENKVSSKKELASILNIAPTTVSAWSKGRIFPSVSILIKIAILTHTSLDWLLLGKNNADEGLDEDIFNKVFEEGYSLAKQYKLTINGSYFLGLYSLVIQELEKDPKLSPKKIIENKKNLIIQLRK